MTKSARLDTMNCCLFDVASVLKAALRWEMYGTNEPKTLDTAFDVMGDIILSTAAQQYGGFTVPEVDKILAPYAEKSYRKYREDFLPMRILPGRESEKRRKFMPGTR